jgi:2-keto-4-pentenoate hydratase
MTAASDYLENKVLDHVLRYSTAPYTAPSTLYLALFNNVSTATAANLEAGILTDETVTTGGTLYARQTITFGAASTGTSTSNATVTFPAAGASWGTITHVAIMDGGTRGAGNVLFYGAVTTSKTIDTGDTFQVTSGNLTISLA